MSRPGANGSSAGLTAVLAGFRSFSAGVGRGSVGIGVGQWAWARGHVVSYGQEGCWLRLCPVPTLLGRACFPGVALALLRALAGRATLHVRADGDAVGWQIVRTLLRLPNATPWRMEPGCDFYEEALLTALLDDLYRPGR